MKPKYCHVCGATLERVSEEKFYNIYTREAIPPLVCSRYAKILKYTPYSVEEEARIQRDLDRDGIAITDNTGVNYMVNQYCGDQDRRWSKAAHKMSQENHTVWYSGQMNNFPNNFESLFKLSQDKE